MLLHHISLLILTGFAASHAQPNLSASRLNDLKLAHNETRTKLAAKWASDKPSLEELLCAKPAQAGHVTKNPNVQESPTITLSHLAVAKLKEDGVPVFTACQVRLQFFDTLTKVTRFPRKTDEELENMLHTCYR